MPTRGHRAQRSPTAPPQPRSASGNRTGMWPVRRRSDDTGGVTHPALTYASYLKIDELLSLQQPRSDGPEHDEMLFIVIHQVYELWFKQVLWELDHAVDLLDADDQPTCGHTLNRVLSHPQGDGRPDGRARDDDPARVRQLPCPARLGERLPVGAVPRARSRCSAPPTPMWSSTFPTGHRRASG